jgi:hypothetical protein
VLALAVGAGIGVVSGIFYLTMVREPITAADLGVPVGGLVGAAD